MRGNKGNKYLEKTWSSTPQKGIKEKKSLKELYYNERKKERDENKER